MQRVYDGLRREHHEELLVDYVAREIAHGCRRIIPTATGYPQISEVFLSKLLCDRVIYLEASAAVISM